jgi:hypothetical protein
MKKLIVLALAFVLVLLRAVGGESVTIEGQVFIRTAGGDNIKLSLVDVGLFDEKAIAENLDAKHKAGEPIYEAMQPYVRAAQKRLSEARAKWTNDTSNLEIYKAYDDAIKASVQTSAEAEYPHSTLYYFSNLPEALQTTKTDADGKFSFKALSGSYVLVAASSRSAGEKTEFYHWMVKVKVSADAKIMLANDNLSSSGSPDSLIRTRDGSDSYIFESMKGKSIDTVAAFLEENKRARAAVEAARQEAAKQAYFAELEEFRKNPKAAQIKAVELYPELGIAGSPLNIAFVARLKRYKIEKAEFFSEPDWPIRLAKECNEEPEKQAGK